MWFAGALAWKHVYVVVIYTGQSALPQRPYGMEPTKIQRAQLRQLVEAPHCNQLVAAEVKICETFAASDKY